MKTDYQNLWDKHPESSKTQLWSPTPASLLEANPHEALIQSDFKVGDVTEHFVLYEDFILRTKINPDT